MQLILLFSKSIHLQSTYQVLGSPCGMSGCFSSNGVVNVLASAVEYEHLVKLLLHRFSILGFELLLVYGSN